MNGMSVDLSEFETLSLKPGDRCTVGLALKALGGEAEKLNAALKAQHIPGSNISRWLAARNLKVSAVSVNRHRRGECACV